MSIDDEEHSRFKFRFSIRLLLLVTAAVGIAIVATQCGMEIAYLLLTTVTLLQALDGEFVLLLDPFVLALTLTLLVSPWAYSYAGKTGVVYVLLASLCVALHAVLLYLCGLVFCWW